MDVGCGGLFFCWVGLSDRRVDELGLLKKYLVIIGNWNLFVIEGFSFGGLYEWMGWNVLGVFGFLL